MIAKLKGLLDGIHTNQVVLDVNGVGYSLLCSNSTLQALPAIGDFMILFVEPLIRQESITLFGFATEEEREAFRLLLTVQGVGGKVCLSLLSSVSPAVIQRCLQTQDHAPLTQADGVGPKLALRIVRELKDKVISTHALLSSPVASGKISSSGGQEAISALVNLGYKKQEVQAIIEKILQAGEEVPLGKLIPQALQLLGKING